MTMGSMYLPDLYLDGGGCEGGGADSPGTPVSVYNTACCTTPEASRVGTMDTPRFAPLPQDDPHSDSTDGESGPIYSPGAGGGKDWTPLTKLSPRRQSGNSGCNSRRAGDPDDSVANDSHWLHNVSPPHPYAETPTSPSSDTKSSSRLLRRQPQKQDSEDGYLYMREDTLGNKRDYCAECYSSLCLCCFQKCNKTPSDVTLTKEENDDLHMRSESFRKRCARATFTLIYVLLAVVACVVTYSMIQDLVKSMQNPVRSIHYKQVEDYDAPGIAVYPGNASFLACGHYYNNVVTSKVRLTQLDLVNRNCTYSTLSYPDPYSTNVSRDVMVIRGPTSFTKREAIFLHFSLNDVTRDFFTVSYFVFPNYDSFVNGSDPEGQISKYHTYMPTFALSAGLRMWMKLIMSEKFMQNDTKHTEFNVEYSVVQHVDRRDTSLHDDHLFFIFFEWKNDIIEQSYLLYTTTPWTIGAGLCGVFLTLHRGYQLAQMSYHRIQKDKKRRTLRKQTIAEIRQQRAQVGNSRKLRNLVECNDIRVSST